MTARHSRHDPLERRRLTATLVRFIDEHALVALIAPAGYGKTTAVASACECSVRPAVWYRARSWQRGEFLAPLVRAMRTERPDFGRMTLALATRYSNESDELTRAAAEFGERLGASFANELEHVPEPITIVIDDAHVLDDDPLFSPFLTAALDELPSHARFVIIARSAPRLPFAQWTAAGRCAVLSTDDLKFDDDDVAELGRRFGFTQAVSTEDLRERFDGWAAGLALFFAAGERTIPAEGRSLGAYSAYLLDANIAALGSELVTFLEDTCVYERLDAHVLEHDQAISHARERLAQLERSGVMVAVERPNESYRLHALFREALRERVKTRDGDAALRQAHLRVSKTLEGLGENSPALYHLERAGDGDYASAFLLRHAYQLFVAGAGERAARIARRFASTSSFSSSVAALIDGMLLRQYGLPGAAERFAAGLRSASSAGAPEVVTALRLVSTEDALSRRVLPSRTDVAWLEERAHDEGDPRVAAEASMYAGWTHAIGGDFAVARNASRRALGLAGAALAPRVRATALDAYAATCQGLFDEADRELTMLLGDLESSDALVLLANTLVWYARLALLWGDVESARDYAEQGDALARRLDLGAELAGVLLARAEIATRQGDLSALRAFAEDARRYASAAWYVADRNRSLALATLFDARATFAIENSSRALARLERLIDSDLAPAQRLCAHIDTAAYRFATSDPNAISFANAGLAVAANVRANDALDAVELDRAFEVAQAIGAEVPPSLAAAALRRFEPLLRERHARTERDPARRDKVLVALEALRFIGRNHDAGATEPRGRVASSLSPKADPTIEIGNDLTKREREILALLALGLTNKEMAQRLVLSPRTIDTHVERVLSKLGVPSRTRAIATALRYGLVAAP